MRDGTAKAGARSQGSLHHLKKLGADLIGRR